MPTAFDPAKVVSETMWLLSHPQFEEKPASIREFVGEGCLEIESLIRPGLLEALVDIFGEEVNGQRISEDYERAMLTGAIGIGKNLRPEEMILTPSGWVRNDSLSIGDLVIGKNGGWPTVCTAYDRYFNQI